MVNRSGLVKGMDQAPNIKAEDIHTMISTNLTGLINMTQAILPIFQRRPNNGAGDIINIGSIAGREPYAGGSIYCATKAAVRSFTDALRRELISSRIRVIEIDPGQVETEFSVVRFYGDREKARKVYEGVEPLTPDDVAEIVVFAAGRRENVVVADTLVFPNHQVWLRSRSCGLDCFCFYCCDSMCGWDRADSWHRRPRRLCIGSRDGMETGTGLTSVYRRVREAPCIGSLRDRSYRRLLEASIIEHFDKRIYHRITHIRRQHQSGLGTRIVIGIHVHTFH
jgi:hypothetical protein